MQNFDQLEKEAIQNIVFIMGVIPWMVLPELEKQRLIAKEIHGE